MKLLSRWIKITNHIQQPQNCKLFTWIFNFSSAFSKHFLFVFRLLSHPVLAFCFNPQSLMEDASPFTAETILFSFVCSLFSSLPTLFHLLHLKKKEEGLLVLGKTFYFMLFLCSNLSSFQQASFCINDLNTLFVLCNLIPLLSPLFKVSFRCISNINH